MGCKIDKIRDVNKQFNDDYTATFSKLRISPASVNKLQNIFNKIDLDGSGEIDYYEFINHFGFKRSRFSKRAFAVMDEDGSGEVDFQEFVLSVYNYCTFNKQSLTRFAFDLYDEDNSGLIDADELLLMLKELYGKKNYKRNLKAQNVYKKILSQFSNETTGACEISFIEFRKFCVKYPAMLYPAFTIQSNFQNAILGRSYWESQAKIRRQIEIQVASSDDSNNNDGGTGFQNMMNFLNKMADGNMMNDKFFDIKDNDNNNDEGKEGTSSSSSISKRTITNEKMMMPNNNNSNKLVESKYVASRSSNKYTTNSSEAWVCSLCGRSNKVAKSRCATCKTRKGYA